MDENQQTAAQEPKKSNPSLVIGILFVIALIAGAFWFMSSNNQPATQTQTSQTETTVSEAPTQAMEQTPTGEAMMAQAIAVEGGEFYFKPNVIRVKKGEKVTITLTNAGKMPHDFVIDEFNVESETISSGSTTVEFTPDKAGTFEFYCGVGSHRAQGMKGSLIVE
jgi:plastocyanin